MTGANRKLHIAAETRKGDESLRAAQALLAVGLHNDAVTRMYYAAFHYACAALASIDVQVRSHRALQSLFSLHLVKDGRLPFARAKDLRRLQGYREAADYDVEFHFDRSGADEELEVAVRFIAAIRTLLIDGGWLNGPTAQP